MANTVSPQELGMVLDALGASTVPVPFAKLHAVSNIVHRLVALANQEHLVGALVPEATTESPFPLAEPEPVIELAP